MVGKILMSTGDDELVLAFFIGIFPWFGLVGERVSAAAPFLAMHTRLVV